MADATFDTGYEHEPWFVGREVSHDDINARLAGQDEGCFYISQDPEDDQMYHLFFQAQGFVQHRVIQGDEGFRIAGSPFVFGRLSMLVDQYSKSNEETKDDLPCALVYPGKPAPGGGSGGGGGGGGYGYKRCGGGRAGAGEPWSTADVIDWLMSINMGHHAPAFEKHGINGLSLPSLEDEDLERMGVTDATERYCILSQRQLLPMKQLPGLGRGMRSKAYELREVNGEYLVFDEETGQQADSSLLSHCGRIDMSGAASSRSEHGAVERVVHRKIIRRADGGQNGCNCCGHGHGHGHHRHHHRKVRRHHHGGSRSGGHSGGRSGGNSSHHRHSHSAHWRTGAGASGGGFASAGGRIVNWDQRGRNERDAEASLHGQPDGSFVIYDSNRRNPTVYVLAYVYQNQIHRKFIVCNQPPDPPAVYLHTSSEWMFRDLGELVSYLSSSEQRDLPVCLRPYSGFPARPKVQQFPLQQAMGPAPQQAMGPQQQRPVAADYNQHLTMQGQHMVAGQINQQRPPAHPVQLQVQPNGTLPPPGQEQVLTAEGQRRAAQSLRPHAHAPNQPSLHAMGQMPQRIQGQGQGQGQGQPPQQAMMPPPTMAPQQQQPPQQRPQQPRPQQPLPQQTTWQPVQPQAPGPYAAGAGSQPGSMPGSRPGSMPGSRPGSMPGSQQGSQPGTPAMNRPPQPTQPWNQPTWSREIAKQNLTGRPAGAFYIIAGESELALFDGTNVRVYTISTDGKSYTMEGSSKKYNGLDALVKAHATKDSILIARLRPEVMG